MPKVTIAIPAYNRPQYLRECLESIERQTFRDFEVIVFDNHSEYAVQELLAEFTGFSVRLEQAPQNLGQDGNFLRIYTYSYSSPYVIIFHDDDTMHPRLLEREVAVFEAHPEVVWVGTTLRFVRDGGPMNVFDLTEAGNTYRLCDLAALTREILSGFPLCFDSILFKSGVLEDHMEFVRMYSKWSDRPQVMSLTRHGKAALIPDSLVNYRMHASQDSVRNANVSLFVTCTKNLFLYYKNSLPRPLNGRDRSMWYRFTTNNLISSIAAVSATPRDFWRILKEFRPSFFQWKYLRPKGVYYFLRAFKRFYLA